MTGPHAIRGDVTILLADDDPDDELLVREALGDAGVPNPVACVRDGEELLAYLRRTERYASLAGSALPGLVLLDLNMPRMDGREALAALKADEELRRIPVVVLTTSRAETDVRRSYDLGAASFVTKPRSYDGLVQVMRGLGHYWLAIVELP